MDDVIFSHIDPVVHHVNSYAAIEYREHSHGDSNQILRNDKDQLVLIVSYALVTKSAI